MPNIASGDSWSRELLEWLSTAAAEAMEVPLNSPWKMSYFSCSSTPQVMCDDQRYQADQVAALSQCLQQLLFRSGFPQVEHTALHSERGQHWDVWGSPNE